VPSPAALLAFGERKRLEDSREERYLRRHYPLEQKERKVCCRLRCYWDTACVPSTPHVEARSRALREKRWWWWWK
jgi:hypothetical protein